MKNSFLVAICFLFLCSCKEPEPRRPIKKSTTNFYNEVAEKSKKLVAKERRYLTNYIEKDTVNNYITSTNGFWYYYNKKDTILTKYPAKGDVVTIAYNISDLQGTIIYDEIVRDYKIDKQDLIPALQDGIKLMKKGEIITFVIPSYRAYGILGDQNKIKINQPLKSKVTLINIKPTTNEIK